MSLGFLPFTSKTVEDILPEIFTGFRDLFKDADMLSRVSSIVEQFLSKDSFIKSFCSCFSRPHHHRVFFLSVTVSPFFIINVPLQLIFCIYGQYGGMSKPSDSFFLSMAVDLATSNVPAGGPFGAVVVKDHNVISKGSNQVTSSNDPTAHAEMVAIRLACKKLDSFQLDDCTLYSSCEPCPMCLGAIYWARPSRVVFAASASDASNVGFDDSFIYTEIPLALSERSLPFEQLHIESFNDPFKKWSALDSIIEY